MRSRSTEHVLALLVVAVAAFAVTIQGCTWQPVHGSRGREALEISEEHLESRADLPNLTWRGWSQEVMYIGDAFAVIRVTPKTDDAEAVTGYEVVVDLTGQEVVAVSAAAVDD